MVSRCIARTSSVVMLLGAVSIASVGCGRTMSESDCEKIGNHLREVWDNEVKATAPGADEARSDAAGSVMKSHREHIGSEWMAQCRREIEGRRVSDKEVDCVLKASTIAEVQGCSSR